LSFENKFGQHIYLHQLAFINLTEIGEWSTGSTLAFVTQFTHWRVYSWECFVSEQLYRAKIKEILQKFEQ
jgi:hypothetical protein